jgi:hypothetical protein
MPRSCKRANGSLFRASQRLVARSQALGAPAAGGFGGCYLCRASLRNVQEASDRGHPDEGSVPDFYGLELAVPYKPIDRCTTKTQQLGGILDGQGQAVGGLACLGERWRSVVHPRLIGRSFFFSSPVIAICGHIAEPSTKLIRQAD